MIATTMLHPQFVTTPEGNQTAVLLPIAEYNELLEDIDDLAAGNSLTLFFLSFSLSDHMFRSQLAAIESAVEAAMYNFIEVTLGHLGHRHITEESCGVDQYIYGAEVV